MKAFEIANSIDPDDVVHNEPSRQDLHHVASNIRILNMILLGRTRF